MLTNLTYPDPWKLSLKVTLPPSLALRLKNIDLFPVMCLEHPLSKYHFSDFLFPCRHICSRNDKVFRYPHFLGSCFVSA